MTAIPKMRRDLWLIRTCGLRGCDRHAEWISTDPARPLAICHFHMCLIDKATVTVEKMQEAQERASSKFDIADLGELDDHGNVIAGPGDITALPKKGNPSSST